MSPDLLTLKTTAIWLPARLAWPALPMRHCTRDASRTAARKTIGYDDEKDWGVARAEVPAAHIRRILENGCAGKPLPNGSPAGKSPGALPAGLRRSTNFAPPEQSRPPTPANRDTTDSAYKRTDP